MSHAIGKIDCLGLRDDLGGRVLSVASHHQNDQYDREQYAAGHCRGGEDELRSKGDTRPLLLSLRKGGSATGLSVTGARALPMQVIIQLARYLGE